MLATMRKASKNIFVQILLGALALSFVSWGVGDMFRGRTSNALAQIGDSELSYDEYNNSLKRELARYQQILGRTLTEEQIDQFNIKAVVLNQMIDNILIRQRVEDIRLKIGDDAAKQQILANSMFFDDSGKFSQNNFDVVMKANGLNKDQYVMALKQDTAIRLFVDTLSAMPASLSSQAEVLYNYRNEQRVADLVVVPADYIKEVPEPTEPELVQYYQENSEQFVAPEMREVTYIKYSVEDVSNNIQITQELVRAEYEQNIELYQDAEKREVDQYLFDSESEAAKALEAIKAGKAGAYADLKISLGNVGIDGLTYEIGQVVFSLPEKTYSQPVQSELGWHLFYVKSIAESRTLPFSDVELAIAQQLRETQAAEIFYDSAESIEDEFASGLSIEDVAKKFDLVIHKIPSIDSMGRGIGGKTLSHIPDIGSFVPLVFGYDVSETSPMTLLPDNITYVATRVDAVSPQRVKALDEVKGTVITLWKKQKHSEQLKEVAAKVAVKLKEGALAKQLAQSMKLKYKKGNKIARPHAESFVEDDNGVPLSLSKELFAINNGESTSAYLSSSGEFFIGQLKEIKSAKMKEEQFASLHNNLKQDFADDVLRQYNGYLRQKYPITVNESLLKSSSL